MRRNEAIVRSVTDKMQQRHGALNAARSHVARLKRGGMDRTRVAGMLAAALAAHPESKPLQQAIQGLTQDRLIAREKHPFLETAPSVNDFDQSNWLVLGTCKYSGTRWTMDPGRKRHVLGVGISQSGKSTWALWLMATILNHESGGPRRAAAFQSGALLPAGNE